jgi:hypothetical protein
MEGVMQICRPGIIVIGWLVGMLELELVFVEEPP